VGFTAGIVPYGAQLGSILSQVEEIEKDWKG
jgi:hypothetical protein